MARQKQPEKGIVRNYFTQIFEDVFLPICRPSNLLKNFADIYGFVLQIYEKQKRELEPNMLLFEGT